MLRPATPLSILLFVAFVLLLLSVLSTPIIPGIKLATYDKVDYGVFGYCIDGQCSGIRVGYNPETKNDDFRLSKDVRHSLTSLLIVHPVAALFTLILLCLSLSAHLHKPSHSPRYLLGLLILTLPTLLLTLLAFLVDVLLFNPHLMWAGWVVLASTILITASGIVTCAMRRTLVSRKARKKRIAENAEMNGENFYARQRDNTAPASAVKPTAPSLSTSNQNQNGDHLPSFTTYDASKDNSDDTVPLHSRSPSQKPNGGLNGAPRRPVVESVDDDEIGRYAPVTRTNSGPGARSGAESYGGGRDEYGNPLAPSAAFGAPNARRSPSDPRNRPQYGPSPGPGSYNRGPSPYGGGRGGFVPPGGRGGYGRGPPPGSFRGPSPGPRYGEHGAFGGAAVAGGMIGPGQRGPPPPGYNNGYGNRNPSPGPAYQGAEYGRRPSPGPPVNTQFNDEPPPQVVPSYRNPSPASRYGPNLYAGRQASPAPQILAAGIHNNPRTIQPEDTHPDSIGQAVEMDATTGSPSHPPQEFGSQGATLSEGNQMQTQTTRDASHPMSMSSTYDGRVGDAYIPPRANWAHLATSQPVAEADSSIPVPHPTAPVAAISSPAELPASPQSDRTITGRPRAQSSDYVEDVPARFSTDQPQPPLHPVAPPPSQEHPALAPTPQHQLQTHNLRPHDDGPVSRNESYEDMQGIGSSGARSPAASDTSHFTSVSQRGINPNWAPPQQSLAQGQQQYAGPIGGNGGGSGIVGRRPVPQSQQQQRDVLAGNNDFAIPRNGPIHGDAGLGRYPGPHNI